VRSVRYWDSTFHFRTGAVVLVIQSRSRRTPCHADKLSGPPRPYHCPLSQQCARSGKTNSAIRCGRAVLANRVEDNSSGSRPAWLTWVEPAQRELLHHRSKQDRHAPILLRGEFGCPGCRTGEAVHFVQTGGDNRPYQWRVGAPSYPNLSSINNPDHHPVTNMLCRCWTLLEVQEVQAALWCRQTGQDQWS